MVEKEGGEEEKFDEKKCRRKLDREGGEGQGLNSL